MDHIAWQSPLYIRMPGSVTVSYPAPVAGNKVHMSISTLHRRKRGCRRLSNLTVSSWQSWNKLKVSWLLVCALLCPPLPLGKGCMACGGWQKYQGDRTDHHIPVSHKIKGFLAWAQNLSTRPSVKEQTWSSPNFYHPSCLLAAILAG